MKKIAIVGATGSGKTTFARQLAQKINCPVVDLDDLYWKPGWINVSTDEFKRKADEATAQPSWIVTGNYSVVRDIVWGRANTVIWLDYSFPVVLWQLLRRTFDRMINKKLVCNGNIENWRRFFSRDSILLWLLTSFTSKRREYGALMVNHPTYPDVAFIRLRTRGEALRFLQQNQ